MIIGNQVSSQLDNTNKGDSHFLRTLNTVIATPRQYDIETTCVVRTKVGLTQSKIAALDYLVLD